MKQIVMTAMALCWYSASLCQTNDPGNFAKMSDFLPPAPNAAAIIKHSEITLNKNTGSPAINIPLYVLKGNKLSVPVSLGYSSTGIKVDEIASRVGMGWTLNAGGVITRTQRGNPDEQSMRIVPPYEPVQQNCGSFNYMNNISTNISYDAEPDLFNFSMNGISGSFVLDSDMQPMQIPAGRNKIEYDFNGTAWNFKITTTDGIVYYFGGTGAIEKTKRETSCGKSHADYVNNAWYLSKIVHPSGETITFQYTPITYTYDNGVSQSLEWVNPQLDCGIVGPTVSCPPGGPPYSYSTCTNKVNTQGVLLSSIYNASSTISFSYQTRADCGDKLVSSITQTIAQINAPAYQSSFNFNYNEQQANLAYASETATGYDKTPYLASLQEFSSGNQFSKTHYFSYNDPASRPPRLSFSQDHWGYFNGKNNQGSFIPKPDDITLKQHFPTATANREPDPVFAGKGMLTKIVYPTGGIDNIEYEGNQVQNVTTSYKTYHEFTCSVQGNAIFENSQISNFSIDNAQQIQLVINSVGTGVFEEIHNYSTVIVNGPQGNVFTGVFRPSDGTCIRYLNPTYPLAPGNYTITLKAKGAPITTSVVMKYYPKTTSSINKNTIVGGVRVRRVFTGNPGETPMIKKYYYADIADLTVSSLFNVQHPQYSKNYQRSLNCIAQIGTGDPGPLRCHQQCTAMYSGSLNNLYDYHSSPISYGSVIESVGENFEGGATQSKFYTGADARGQVIWGQDIPNATLSNFSSITNGNLREVIHYKKATNGNLFPLKKTVYDYPVDNRANREVFGYAVNKAYEIYAYPGNNCPPSTSVTEDQINAFDMVKYSIISYWAPLKTTTETVYDENGQNPVTSISNYYYDNTSHLQATRIEGTNSKGQSTKTTTTYPHDYVGNSVYDAMIANNIISPVIDTKLQTGNTITNEQKVNYGSYNSGNLLPQTFQTAVKGNALETEGSFDRYDANGNVLQLTNNKTGIVTTILWGYGYKYPVAEIKGATYDQVVVQLSAGGIPALQTMDDAALQVELNRIRTNLPSAYVTTYTYKPGAGVTSITDTHNKTNSYEYDAFNRLLLVKDQDGNVVKKNEYMYTTPDPGATTALFFNQPFTSSIQCQSCAAGYTGNFVSYTVPYGKYFSLISQADADAKALLDTEGQEYANKNGTCSSACDVPTNQ
ncbi:DUF5977 domain-containing protein [Ferruginibacter profundus]